MQIGVMDFKYAGKIAPTHRSRDTAHAQWLQTHSQWYPMGDVRTHNSRTDSRRIFKLGGRVDHNTQCMATQQGQKVKGQKVKGQGHKVT